MDAIGTDPLTRDENPYWRDQCRPTPSTFPLQAPTQWAWLGPEPSQRRADCVIENGRCNSSSRLGHSADIDKAH